MPPSPPPASPPLFEYLEVFCDYAESPDYDSLGNDGWDLVAIYESAAPPRGTGQPFEGRTFVFKRQKQ